MSNTREAESKEIAIEYLNNAFGAKDALPSAIQQAALEALANGSYHHTQLERLTGRGNGKIKIFSYRYSDAGRLLLIPKNGGWLVLEDVPNHDYDKARFMNPNVLARLLKKKEEWDALDAPSLGVDARALSEDEIAALPARPTHPSHVKTVFKPVTYLNNQFISLSEAQKKLLERMQQDNPKILLAGHAGSGKTSLLWEVLIDGIQRNASNIVCITKNKSLIDYWRDQADSSPVLANLVDSKVD